MEASRQITSSPPAPSELISPLRDASRELVRKWDFLQPTLAGSSLSPAAAHCLIEIGDHGLYQFSSLRAELRVSSERLGQILSELVARGNIISDNGFRITPAGKQVLLGINRYAQDQVAKALTTAPPGAAADIITAFRLYTAALRQAAAASAVPITPGASRPSSPTFAPVPPAPQVVIVAGYRPGILGRCLEMHMDFYPKFNGWGVEFEAGLASSLSDFLNRLSRPLNEMWAAIQTTPPQRPGLPATERIVGTVFIDGDGAGLEGVARLRAFIVDDSVRGTGVGKKLLAAAMSFVREMGFSECRLSTMRTLLKARRLYEAEGFRELQETLLLCWGVQLPELEYVWTRDSAEPSGR